MTLVYSFELIKHANIRYRQTVPVLAHCELFAMLSSLGITCDIQHEEMGGSRFLTFECRELSALELSFLSSHSSVVFMADKKDGLLHPLPVCFQAYLPEDLPEVLKYKGKTSATFTRMMINVAVSLSPFRGREDPLTFFDPVCGKGTGCFCAVMGGMNAVGLDLDRKDIRESADYFSRYLKFHKIKHEEKNRSETISGKAVPVTVFRFADTKEHYLANEIHTLSFACADTAESPVLRCPARASVRRKARAASSFPAARASCMEKGPQASRRHCAEFQYADLTRAACQEIADRCRFFPAEKPAFHTTFSRSGARRCA